MESASVGPFSESGKDINSDFLVHAPNEDFWGLSPRGALPWQWTLRWLSRDGESAY